ncbi:MAG: hypothetical protein ACFFG0_44970 [Candidatus Thorarchaeota archaeon]
MLEKLIDNKIIDDEYMFNYNMDFLIKAFCIKSTIDEISKEIYYEITQSGKVIEYLE